MYLAMYLTMRFTRLIAFPLKGTFSEGSAEPVGTATGLDAFRPLDAISFYGKALTFLRRVIYPATMTLIIILLNTLFFDGFIHRVTKCLIALHVCQHRNRKADQDKPWHCCFYNSHKQPFWLMILPPEITRIPMDSQAE